MQPKHSPHNGMHSHVGVKDERKFALAEICRKTEDKLREGVIWLGLKRLDLARTCISIVCYFPELEG